VVREEGLQEELVGLVARRLQMLSDPLRLRLLLALERDEYSVGQLADVLDRSHKVTSHHLNVLFGEGLIARRREGTSVVYSLADYSVCRLLALAGQGVTARIEELGELIVTS
jgi:DNA-binding transcriptional ArsR family regulator